MNRFFEVVDKSGVAYDNEPYFEDGLKEIIRIPFDKIESFIRKKI